MMIIHELIIFHTSTRETKALPSKEKKSWVVVAHAFNCSTWEAEADRSLLIQGSLAYKVSSKTARAVIQRSPVSTNKFKYKTGFFFRGNPMALNFI